MPRERQADSRGAQGVLDAGAHWRQWRIRWIGLCGGGNATCRYHYCSNLFAIIIAISVSASVYLCARLSQKPHVKSHRIICVCCTYGHGSFLLGQQCNSTYFRFCECRLICVTSDLHFWYGSAIQFKFVTSQVKVIFQTSKIKVTEGKVVKVNDVSPRVSIYVRILRSADSLPWTTYIPTLDRFATIVMSQPCV